MFTFVRCAQLQQTLFKNIVCEKCDATRALQVFIQAAPINAAILFRDRSLPLVDRTLKNRTKLVWRVLVTYEQTHLRKTTRYSVWSQHFCEKSPSPCDEEKSVNLSQSWLNHVFSVFLSSYPQAFAMSKLSSNK